jgi:outer membrane lipoprotein-sorting protein
MKQIRFLLLCLAALLPLALGAQTQKAQAVLDKCADAVRQSSGLQAAFTLTDAISSPKNAQTIEGTLTCRQSKFVLDLPQARTWFDGQTQWSYLKANGEVNVTSPTPEEIALINPLSILDLYKHGYRLSYKGERTVDGKKVAEVEMIADNDKTAWRKLFVRINTQTNLPLSVVIRDKNGNTATINFKSIKQGLNLTDKDFVFNKADYPGVDIIDLR